MVQTDRSQLLSESKEWHQILRNYRDEFSDSKKSLEGICCKNLSKAHLQDVEHFNNQFHIQLINIHDFKQTIKAHERQLMFNERNEGNDLFARHEYLLEEFISLENMLQELRSAFQNFTNDTVCS